MKLVYSLFLTIVLFKTSYSEGTSTASPKVQREAMKIWANQLTDNDYNATIWETTMNFMPSNFFDYYAKKMSDIFLEQKALINFVLVGACDGTHDRTIRDRYLPYTHWRGVFVEPFEMNYRDLVKFMTEHGVIERTHIIHAAATNKCNSTTIKMKRPTFEEKNASLPHWMRRQIGAIVPFDKMHRPAMGGWIFEYTRCIDGQEILADWVIKLGLNKKSKLRPHILKVDVEGHDYEVLMGFLNDDVPSSQLPLIISFEAKSILGKFDVLTQHLQSRGYAVSHLATDGFALLKGEHILSQMGKRKRKGDGEVEGEGDVEQQPEPQGEEGGGEGESPKKKRKGKKKRNVDKMRASKKRQKD